MGHDKESKEIPEEIIAHDRVAVKTHRESICSHRKFIGNPREIQRKQLGFYRKYRKSQEIIGHP